MHIIIHEIKIIKCMVSKRNWRHIVMYFCRCLDNTVVSGTITEICALLVQHNNYGTKYTIFSLQLNAVMIASIHFN